MGFDTETKVDVEKGHNDGYPPSLIQIATNDCVYLYRTCVTHTLEPFLEFMESSSIIKTGVGVERDAEELCKRYESFTPGGFRDVVTLTSPMGYENKGLNALSALILGGRISKREQCSNWARKELNAKQIRYAATDAWVSREIYVKAVSVVQGKPRATISTVRCKRPKPLLVSNRFSFVSPHLKLVRLKK